MLPLGADSEERDIDANLWTMRPLVRGADVLVRDVSDLVELDVSERGCGEVLSFDSRGLFDCRGATVLSDNMAGRGSEFLVDLSAE